MLTHIKNSTLKEILLQMLLHPIYPKMALFWLISSCLIIMNIVASVSFSYMWIISANKRNTAHGVFHLHITEHHLQLFLNIKNSIIFACKLFWRYKINNGIQALMRVDWIKNPFIIFFHICKGGITNKIHK